ncbi:MAG: CsgG/HfaB family protein [Longimicrobiales bacterium]|nr:CsgG/HfaB family protein [Longimicrobiales bacterium]
MLQAVVCTVLAVVFAAPPAAAQEEGEKSVVAVLRFDNNTGDDQYEHLGRALSSMMISDLSVLDEKIQLVERERLEELTEELDFQQSAYVDPSSAQSLGMIVGAEYVVAGAFVTAEPVMRLDTRIARVETSEIVTTAEVTGERETLFDLQQRLADELVQGLDLVLTEEERARLREQQEANRIDDLQTFVAFSQALCLMDYGDYAGGLEKMQEVQLAAPGSGLVRATLNTLRDKAEEEAKDRLVNEAGRRLGGLLGRDPPRPQRNERALAC